MTTDTGQTSSRVKKFVIYLLVISALLAAPVLAGLIWQSQKALSRDSHLTSAGALILLWNPVKHESVAIGGGPSLMHPVDSVLRRPDLTMTPAAAALLAKNYGNMINLDVPQLSPSVARGLSQSPYGLCFWNLEVTSPELLAALVSGRCPQLSLPIPNLTEAGAKALSQFKGDRLTVTHMTRLSPEAANALSRCETANLSLEGLDHLSEEAAEELSRCRTGWLSIGGGWLRSSPTTLSLRSLDSISETTASALSRFQGRSLTLYVKHISEEVAVALSHYPGLLALTTLETLPDAAAHALAGRKLLKVGLGASNGPHQLEKLPASAAAILREANNNSQ